jgi:hypothetical protein
MTTQVTTNLTAVEVAALQAIVNSDFFEGAGSCIWTECIEGCNGFTTKQIQGTLPRLVEKGFISQNTYGKVSERTTVIYEAGIEAVKAATMLVAKPIPAQIGYTTGPSYSDVEEVPYSEVAFVDLLDRQLTESENPCTNAYWGGMQIWIVYTDGSKSPVMSRKHISVA